MSQFWQVLISALALLLTLLASALSFVQSNAVIEYRITQMESKVNHNSTIIESVNHDLEREIHRLEIELSLVKERMSEAFSGRRK